MTTRIPSKASRPAASARVRGEWLRRVAAEYRSAAITQHLTLWLLQVGASPDLVELGLRIVKDELAHAALSHKTFVAAGGQGGPTLARETLSLARREHEPIEHDLARSAVEVFCLGETIAVPLFHRLRKGCTVPVARRALDRVLADEVRHRDFGWTLLAWMNLHPRAIELREVVTRELPAMFTRLRASYASPDVAGELEIPDADRAWGLMPASEYAAVFARSEARDFAPRFAKLGYDVRGLTAPSSKGS